MTPKFETRNSKLENRLMGYHRPVSPCFRGSHAEDDKFRFSNFDFRVFPNPESRILNPAGVALLAVMSAITVLVLVALAFSGSVQLETRTAIYRKESTQAYALATGGIQAALLEIAYPPPPMVQQDEPRAWKEGQRSLQVSYARGKALVEIVNETGKLDMNLASREQLRRLLEARGLAPDEAKQLAAAIQHWRGPATPDDQQSEALEQYYRDAGYSPAHQYFTSVEEVLRVRGMSRDIFYGTAVVSREARIQSQYGVGQDLTIYSGSSQVNVNYATEAVLRSLPDVSAELAQAIVQEREKEPFKSVEDIAQRLAVALPDEAVPFLSTLNCDTYSITAVGELNGSRVRRTVKAVVQLTPEEADQHHRIIAWYNDVTD